jgi:hypothetical protein
LHSSTSCLRHHVLHCLYLSLVDVLPTQRFAGSLVSFT